MPRVAEARSSSGGVVIHYVLPVLWMAPCLHIMNWVAVSGTKCAVKRPSSPYLWPIRQDSATYFVLIGRSHGELGRFTAHSLPQSSDEMRSAEMRRDEWYERSLKKRSHQSSHLTSSDLIWVDLISHELNGCEATQFACLRPIRTQQGPRLRINFCLSPRKSRTM